MKTKHTGIVILAKVPKAVARGSRDKLISIRTKSGALMTNRLRSLLCNYGSRLQIPSALILEILKDRNLKSRQLKTVQGELDDALDLIGNYTGVVEELSRTARNLLDAIDRTTASETISTKIAELDEALNVAEDFIDDTLSSN